MANDRIKYGKNVFYHDGGWTSEWIECTHERHEFKWCEAPSVMKNYGPHAYYDKCIHCGYISVSDGNGD